MAFTGTGQESLIAFGEETTYGTGVTPTEFLPFVSENLAHRRNVNLYSESLGVTQQYSTHVARNGAATGGSFSLEPWLEGNEILLKYGLGDHFTTLVAMTDYCQHYFRIGRYAPMWKGVADVSANSLTCSVYRGKLATGFGYVTRYTGMKISRFKARFEQGRIGRIDCDALFYDSSALASPTDVTQGMFDHGYMPHPQRAELAICDIAQSMTWNDVTAFSFELSVDHKLAQEWPVGYNGGTTGQYPLPLQPHRTGPIEVTARAEVLMRSSDTLHGTYTLRQLEEQNLCHALRWIQYGQICDGCTSYMRHVIEGYGARVTNIDPAVGGPGNIRRTLDFELKYPDVTYPALGGGQPSEVIWCLINQRPSFGVHV